jgi:hypothetical protein
MQAPNQISTAPVLSQQQIQQNVNTNRAQTDAGTAAQIRNQNAQMAGRGFGANSPLAQQLASTAQAQGRQSNAAAEQQLRLGGATANAQQVLQAQQANAAANTAWANAVTGRMKNYTDLAGGLVGSLAGMA